MFTQPGFQWASRLPGGSFAHGRASHVQTGVPGHEREDSRVFRLLYTDRKLHFYKIQSHISKWLYNLYKANIIVPTGYTAQ